MNKTSIILATILSTTIIICFGIYIFGNRYSTINAGSGRIYKIDRLTGKTIYIYNGNIKDIESENKYKKEEWKITLNFNELSNITGRAGKSILNSFSGNIYNGNKNLTVTDIIINITTTSNGIETSRSYTIDESIEPMTTKDFLINIIEGDEGSTYNWSIQSAQGIPAKALSVEDAIDFAKRR